MLLWKNRVVISHNKFISIMLHEYLDNIVRGYTGVVETTEKIYAQFY